MTTFTAHNIRLDDGTQTFPPAGITMDVHPITRSVTALLRTVYPTGLSGHSIIDVGCLEGGYATEFARLGMTSTGLEVRRSNIENCLFVKSRMDLPNLSFIHDNANNVGKYGQFDVFFINGLLYHLDRPRAFLETVAHNCRKVIILQTHISHAHKTEAARTFSLSEISENEGLPGRWFFEHGEMTTSDLDDLKWASWDNVRSFWIQKEYLLALIRDLGFDLVFEQFDWLSPMASEMTGTYVNIDRVMLIGIKSGASVEVSDSALLQTQAELDAVYRSTSWKITAPLRYLGRFVGR